MKPRKLEVFINGEKEQTFERSEGNEIKKIRIIVDGEVVFDCV